MATNFHDEQGLHWTVTTPDVPGSAGPSHTTLVFTSESGECRTGEAWLPEGATLDNVDARIWCAFLRYSDVTAGTTESTAP